MSGSADRLLEWLRVRIPMAERSKVRVCGRSLVGLVAGSNPAGGMDVCVVCVVRKGRMKDNQDKDTSTDEVQKQRTRE